MRVLVTGASGFVGRYVVPAIAQRGHTVRSLVRPTAISTPGVSNSGAERVQGDLLQPATLPDALRDVDSVAHLAISLTADREVQLTETIQSTRNLLDAMAAARVSRLVHCSSRAVYDWGRAEKAPDELAPIDTASQLRDEYAQAKIAQEELIQQYTAQHNWSTTILRPGFIWGPGREQLSGWGHSFGPIHLVVNDRRLLPMTYVENCADCFALAIDQPAAAGQVFNVIDDDLPTARTFAELTMKQAGQGGAFVSVPYWPGLALARLATGINGKLLGDRVNLPGLLTPTSYRARFHPLHLSNERAKTVLGWRPRFNFTESWQRCCAATEASDGA